MIYTIKKGSHRSSWFPRITFKKTISFSFKFLTPILESEYTNKIYGLIDGILPHKNSIRLGFRKEKGELLVCAIVYNNGVRTITTLKEINSEYIYVATINKTKYEYIIYLDFEKYVFKRVSNFNLFSFRLFPYWGGKETAKENFKIEINER
jgi:hypothetical protein